VEHNRVPGPGHTPFAGRLCCIQAIEESDSTSFAISESSFKSLVGVSCDLSKENVLLNSRDAEGSRQAAIEDDTNWHEMRS
jgi:hypothetical protein